MKDMEGYVVKGVYHQQQSLKCQDYIYGTSKRKIKAIALADGAGETDYAYEGARTAVRTAVKLLIDRFDEFYDLNKAELQYQVIVNIRENLFKLCDKYQITLRDVQSTLLAIACDQLTNRIIILHLGDGYIIREVGDKREIFSYPNNGRSKYETYLTSMIPVKKYLRVYRGIMNHRGKFYLLSDGWNELLRKTNDIFKSVDYDKASIASTDDDLSIISICV